jgi:hypothetical protein
MMLLFGALIVTKHLPKLQRLDWSFWFVWFVWSVSFVWLNETNQMNQINQIDQKNQMDQKNLLFFGLLAAGPSTHHHQGEDGQTQEPEARPAIGRIGELNEIGQSPDQERHAGHHGVAEGRAKRDHQEEDSCPGHDLAWPGVLDGEEKVKQHGADPNQNDDRIETAGGI